MRVAVDMHVHLYPFYDPHALLSAAARNLREAAPDADLLAIYLTDRADHHAFLSLSDGTLPMAAWHRQDCDDPLALSLATRDGRRLLVVAARQIVTAERIEVLALGTDAEVADGGPAGDTLARVRDAGALPVLPWGLGKWLGARGRIVRNLIDSASPGALAVADTCLRPAILPEAPILRAARSRNLRVLAGTDPLPRQGEEEMAGRFGVIVEGTFDSARPAASLTSLLSSAAAPMRPIGRRCSLAEAFSRAW